MPLSPTPLLPSIGRFPQLPMLGHMGPYQHLLLATQYGQQNPFMPRPNPLMPNAANGLPMELMEQLQRLIQLQNLVNAEPKQGRDYLFIFEYMSLIFFQL